MNIPTAFLERLAKPLPVEPPDPAPQPLGAVVEATVTAAGALLRTERASVHVTALADAVVEVRVVGVDDLAVPSFARVEPLPFRAPAALCEESADGWSLTTANLLVAMRRDPLRLSILARDGQPLLADEPQLGLARGVGGWRAHCALPDDARVYGLGAKTGSLQRRGRRTALWTRDMVVGEHSDPLYSAVPLLLIARGGRWIGVLVDSAARTVFDLGHSAPTRLAFGPQLGALVYVVFAGPTLRDVLAQFTAFSGRAPLPPRWALGHHQSRYSYDDDEEVREIAAEFRRRDIPTDAIHLDIHYMRGFRVFTFESRRFPEPARLTADLAAEGFRLVTIVDPGVKIDRAYDVYREGRERGYFASHPDGRVFSMKVWPGDSAFADFYRADVRQWWGDWHRVYTEAGIGGIWNDMNEPSGWRRAWYVGNAVLPFGDQDTSDMQHRLDDGRVVPHAAVRNAFGHEECRATYEGLLRLRPAERPFVLTRSAFAGTQRYAAQWTGDVPSSWPALRQSVPMMLSMGLCGASFVGSDIGGFVSNSTPELYARWIQIGALAPFCRSHSSLHTRRQEPWSFGPHVEAIARAWLKLRYRLLPYLYTCFWETAETGVPVWRPLFAEFPDDEGIAAVEDQVMVGPSLLAAPVLQQGSNGRRVVLPSGQWFDWHGGQLVDGGGAIEVAAPLERMPLFVRASAALPMQNDVRHTGDATDGPLVWHLFVAPNASGGLGALYEDDGISFAYREGGWRTTPVSAESTAAGVAVRFGPSRGDYTSPRTAAQVRLFTHGLRAVRVDGTPLADGAALQFPHDGAAHVLELERRD